MQDAHSNPSDILTTLLEVDQSIAAIGADDPHAFYELLHHAACRIATVDSFYICLYSEPDDTLFFPYNYEGRIYDPPVTLPVGNGPTSWVVRNRQTFIMNTTNAPTHQNSIPFGDITRVSLSAVHVPMFAAPANTESPLLGVLSAQSYIADAYKDIAVRALQWLADRAGMTLHRHREEAVWRHSVHRQEAQRASQRSALALTSTFTEMLAGLSRQSETMRSLLPADSPQLHAAFEQFCHHLRRCQTEANQLPLRPEFAPPRAVETVPVELTEREREILLLLASGATNAVVARQLFISPDTVKFHCNNLYRKLGVSNRLQAVQRLSPALLPPTRTGR